MTNSNGNTGKAKLSRVDIDKAVFVSFFNFQHKLH